MVPEGPVWPLMLLLCPTVLDSSKKSGVGQGGSSMAARKNGKAKGPRMIKEILRLRAFGLGSKAVAATLGISKNTVKAYLKAHEQAVSDGVPGPVVLALARDTAATAPPYAAPWAPLV